MLTRIITGSMLCTISLFIISCEQEDTKNTISYIVTFNADGGSIVKPQTVEKGEKATKPTDPTRKDYIFKGWYKDKDLTQVFDFDTPITVAIILYAKWEKDNGVTHIVRFETYRGTTVNSQTVKEGEKASPPAPPTDEGSIFKGWYTDPVLTQVFDFNTPITATIILYAKWEKSGTTTSEKQLYSVEIKFTWTADKHGPFPGAGHFTGVFATAHNSTFTLYAVGKILSPGMEVLAESGGTGGIVNEVIPLTGNSILNHVVSSSGFPAVSTYKFDIEVNPTYPHVSIATMIAPSPDWFVGLKVKLYENGTYKTRLAGTMGVYDGGTEEGTGFNLSNPETNPKEPVSKLTSMNGVDIDFTQKPMATYVIQKK